MYIVLRPETPRTEGEETARPGMRGRVSYVRSRRETVRSRPRPRLLLLLRLRLRSCRAALEPDLSLSDESRCASWLVQPAPLPVHTSSLGAKRLSRPSPCESETDGHQVEADVERERGRLTGEGGLARRPSLRKCEWRTLRFFVVEGSGTCGWAMAAEEARFVPQESR